LKRYVLPGEGRRRDKVRTHKELSEQGALTNWERQREGQVRTWKGRDQARGTHTLETAEGGTSQDTERNRHSKEHSHPEDGRERDKSGYGKTAAEKGVLTSWIQQREGQVRTRKETDRARGTHFLETAEGGTSQDTERTRPRKWPSHPGDSRGRGKSRPQRKRLSAGHSQTGNSRGRDKSGHRKKPIE